MSLRWYTIVIDCRDIAAQARWWAEVLGWKIIYESESEVVVIPKHVPEEKPAPEDWSKVGPGLVFVTVPEAKAGKNRLHIDLAPYISDDRDAEIQRLVDLGATTVDVGQDGEKVSWTVLADPEGNEFCVLSAREW